MSDDSSILHVGSPSLEGARSTTPGLPYREGVFLQVGVYRCLSEGVGGSVQWCSSKRGLETNTKQTPYQPPGATFLASDRPACLKQDGQYDGGFQGGTRSLPLLKRSRSLWCSVHFLSFRATHIPCCLNLSADLHPGGDRL